MVSKPPLFNGCRGRFDCVTPGHGIQSLGCLRVRAEYGVGFECRDPLRDCGCCVQRGGGRLRQDGDRGREQDSQSSGNAKYQLHRLDLLLGAGSGELSRLTPICYAGAVMASPCSPAWNAPLFSFQASRPSRTFVWLEAPASSLQPTYRRPCRTVVHDGGICAV